MSSPVIECVELTKAYSKHIVALNNLTLTINEGATVANMMIGAIGLLVNCIFISTLTVVSTVA